jgi:hypothetical protein
LVARHENERVESYVHGPRDRCANRRRDSLAPARIHDASKRKAGERRRDAFRVRADDYGNFIDARAERLDGNVT